MDNALMSSLIAQLGLSSGVVHLIELLKSKYGPSWIRGDTSTLNKWVSTFAALVIGLGVTISGGADIGWVITIPPVNALVDAVGRIMLSRMIQQLYYKNGVKPSAPSAPQTFVMQETSK